MTIDGIVGLFSAAAVNTKLSNGLLRQSTREAIIKKGYLGKPFAINEEEMSKIVNSIGDVEKLSELASAVINVMPELRTAGLNPRKGPESGNIKLTSFDKRRRV